MQTPIEGIGHGPNPARQAEVAHAQFPQGLLQRLERQGGEARADALPCRAGGPQPLHHEKDMQREQVETAIDRIGNPESPVEFGRARLMDNCSVKAAGGLLPGVRTAKTGKHSLAPAAGPAREVDLKLFPGETTTCPAATDGARLNKKVAKMRCVARALIASAFLFSTSACTAVQNQRGYVPDQEAFNSIVVGEDTRASISEKLGNPSVSATFNDNIWYYISSYDIQTAFFAPRSMERDIVAVEFSETGQVANVSRFGLEDGRIVDYVDRETPVRGRDLTILQQIFNAVPGNVGVPQQPVTQNPGGGGAPPP